MKTLISQLDRVLHHALATLMAVMVFNVLWQVASRYLFNAPSSHTEEIAQFLLIWIGLLGAAYAFGRGSHLGLDLFTRYLVGSTRKAATLMTVIVVLLFTLAVMVYGGGRLVLLILSLQQTSPALGIPMGYIYLAIPLSGVLIALYCLDTLLHTLKERTS